MQAPPETLKAAKAVKAARLVRRNFASFLRAFPHRENYIWGRPVYEIIRVAQRARDDLFAARSSYNIVVLPPRHSKSSIMSCRFPVWLFLSDPTLQIILVSYSANLANDLSSDARRLAGRLRILDDRKSRLDAWATTSGGRLFSAGIGGSITGFTGNVVIVDDIHKNREEAESRAVRDAVWDSFRNDLMTRLSPVHAVFIIMTRWHVDDLVGRIKEASSSVPGFPSFNILTMPAWDPETGWLFPERFSPDYYEAERALVGSYGWQSLFLCDPQPRRGKIFDVDSIHIVDSFPEGLRYIRAWDLASTAKQRTSDDPDYTVGLKAAMKDGKLYIADVVRGRWDAPERNRRIIAAAVADGPSVHQHFEVVAGYKDTFTQMKQLLHGKSIVKSDTPCKDPVARASPLEPLFEAGNVSLLHAPWNSDFIDEIRSFPGKHDDQVAALVIAYNGFKPAAFLEVL